MSFQRKIEANLYAAGVDLAWGERRPDGVCVIQADHRRARLLRTPWTENIEDHTDAFFCALLGYWHWLHHGRRTQVLGDLESGFIIVSQL